MQCWFLSTKVPSNFSDSHLKAHECVDNLQRMCKPLPWWPNWYLDTKFLPQCFELVQSAPCCCDDPEWENKFIVETWPEAHVEGGWGDHGG